MKLRLLVSASLSLGACLVACAAQTTADDGSSSAAQTAGDAAPEAAAPEADAGPLAPIASFTLADVSTTPKVRFAVGDGAVVDGIQVTASGPEGVNVPGLVLALQAYSPVVGGLPAVRVEVGRQRAPLAKGVYTCEAGEGLGLVVLTGDRREMTAVRGGPSRPCRIEIEATSDRDLPSPPGGTWHRVTAQDVVGHFVATVGPREDASGSTEVVRGAFAAQVIVMQ